MIQDVHCRRRKCLDPSTWTSSKDTGELGSVTNNKTKLLLLGGVLVNQFFKKRSPVLHVVVTDSLKKKTIQYSE